MKIKTILKTVLKIILYFIGAVILLIILLYGLLVLQQYIIGEFNHTVAYGTPVQVEKQAKFIRPIINTPKAVIVNTNGHKEHYFFTPMAIASMKTKYPETIDILIKYGSKYVYSGTLDANMTWKYTTFAELAATYNPNPEIFKKYTDLKNYKDINQEINQNMNWSTNNICITDFFDGAIYVNPNPEVLKEVINTCGEDIFKEKKLILLALLTQAIDYPNDDYIKNINTSKVTQEKLQIVIDAAKKYNVDFNSKDKQGKTALDYMHGRKIKPELQKVLDKNHIKLKSGGIKAVKQSTNKNQETPPPPQEIPMIN